MAVVMDAWKAEKMDTKKEGAMQSED
jgi:hypothetical protein